MPKRNPNPPITTNQTNCLSFQSDLEFSGSNLDRDDDDIFLAVDSPECQREQSPA